MLLKKGTDWKRGTIGSPHDRIFASDRVQGCTCCPHAECICEESCDERCPHHAPILIKGLRQQLRDFQNNVRALIEFGGLK